MFDSVGREEHEEVRHPHRIRILGKLHGKIISVVLNNNEIILWNGTCIRVRKCCSLSPGHFYLILEQIITHIQTPGIMGM